MPLPPWRGLELLFSVGNLPRRGLSLSITTTYYNGLCYGDFARFSPLNRAAGVPLVKAFDIEQRRAANSFTACKIL